MRAPWIAAGITTLALTVAPVASANYYMSKKAARQAAQTFVTNHYASGTTGTVVSGVAATCHPKGLTGTQRGYTYHDWVCFWSSNESCSGRVRIKGTYSSISYRGKIDQGEHCEIFAPAPVPPVPVPRPFPVPAPAPAPLPPPSDCNPNYTGACMNLPGDYDCLGGTGDGPNYVQGPVYVVGFDVYGLDADGDGIGCEPF